jgi:uncharacterized protein YcbX
LCDWQRVQSGAAPYDPGVPIAISELWLAPVKGMQVAPVEAVELDVQGPRGDRALLVVDTDGALLVTTRTPRLLEVGAAYDGERLRLRFPDGGEVTAAVEPGAPATTRLYDGRALSGRLVDGPLADALSEHLGRRVRLLARDDAQTGADDFPVTLMSGASLRALAPPLGGTVPDGRRFRMTLTVEGVDAWEEHGWGGRELSVGEARLRVAEPVPRCVVTTRSPDDGHRDAPVLKALAQLRGARDVTFGVWCEVTRPGAVRRGDRVTLG